MRVQVPPPPPLLFFLLAVLSACRPHPTQIPALSPALTQQWTRALGRSSPKAVLVSRAQFPNLPRFRSWRDEVALRAYVDWADRPESVGFENGVLTADVGEFDLILLRVPASQVRIDAEVQADPIGYTVILPKQPGKLSLQVQVTGPPSLPSTLANLPNTVVPLVFAAVPVRDRIVTIYGDHLAGRQVQVRSRQGQGKILFTSARQINAQVPSLDAIEVIVDGVPTHWVELTP